MARNLNRIATEKGTRLIFRVTSRRNCEALVACKSKASSRIFTDLRYGRKRDHLHNFLPLSLSPSRHRSPRLILPPRFFIPTLCHHFFPANGGRCRLPCRERAEKWIDNELVATVTRWGRKRDGSNAASRFQPTNRGQDLSEEGSSSKSENWPNVYGFRGNDGTVMESFTRFLRLF